MQTCRFADRQAVCKAVQQASVYMQVAERIYCCGSSDERGTSNCVAFDKLTPCQCCPSANLTGSVQAVQQASVYTRVTQRNYCCGISERGSSHRTTLELTPCKCCPNVNSRVCCQLGSVQVFQQASVHMPVDERGLTRGLLTEAAAVVAVTGAQAIVQLCVNWMVLDL